MSAGTSVHPPSTDGEYYKRLKCPSPRSSRRNVDGNLRGLLRSFGVMSCVISTRWPNESIVVKGAAPICPKFIIPFSLFLEFHSYLIPENEISRWSDACVSFRIFRARRTLDILNYVSLEMNEEAVHQNVLKTLSSCFPSCHSQLRD